VTLRRSVPTQAPLVVRYLLSGTATVDSDYVALSGTATIPAGGSEVTVSIVPVDDLAVEANETVTVSVSSADGYAIGSPAFATVTIVSDDVAPDLVVTQLAAPGPAGAGASITVSDTTHNQGTGPAAASQTSFYLSRNLLLEASDPLIGSRVVGALAAGAASVVTTTLVLPTPLESGTYYLFARADAPGTVTETNEQNNSRATNLAVGPDLTVTVFSAPVQVAAGTPFAVTETTVNQGGGSSGASATRFFLSANVLLDASDTPLDARAVPGLAPGATSSATTTITIPAATAAGSYYLFAQADAGGAIVEPNEANNSRLTTIRVGADLTISALTVPARAATGATIQISDTTRNTGSGSAAPSVTAFYLSTNLMLDTADIRLEPSRAVPVLGANEASTVTTTIVLPDVAAGAWYLLANADDGRELPETNESNNTRFAGLQIGPDLTHTLVAVPSSATAGASITVSDTVRNFGAATADPTMVRYYLSTNTTLDAADVTLAAGRLVPALAPNASSAGSAIVPLPAGTAGNYYVLVVADGDRTLPESNEANNTVARFIQIAQ
jgi:subtilase family serine protease